MSEYDKNRTDYEPNFILQPAKTAEQTEAPSTGAVSPDPAKAGAADVKPEAVASTKPEAAEPVKPEAKADVKPEAADDASAKPEAAADTRSDEDDLMTYIFGEEETAKLRQAIEEEECAKRSQEEAQRREEAELGREPAEQRTEAAAKEENEKLHQAAAHEEAAAKESHKLRPESAVSDVLKAAAARADALKSAAAKAEQANEPYRRSTNTINEPIYSGFGDIPNRAAEGNPEASASESRAQSGGFAANGRFGSTNNAAGAHARFENPSFDPGKTGHYTDPRAHFRTDTAGSSAGGPGFRSGESASWSNGEVHRSHKQMKDSIRRQKKQNKQKKPKQPVMLTRKALGLLVAACLCLSCLTGLGGAAIGNAMFDHSDNPTAHATPASVSETDSSGSTTNAGYTLESATGSNMTIKEITAATKNSVVEIRTESVASDTWMQQYVTQGAGSGVIISEDGYIMTNNHVIEGANKIKVTTANEKEYDAQLVGTDETNDVAVLKIDASGLSPATYGNSKELEVGDMAVAIGNPLGELGGTVTAGIISATDRALSIDGKTMHLLQTDSSINPGNSGGGLFNGDGQLVGLVVAKSSGSDVEGLGFAIPINTAADVAKQLIEKGYVSGQPSTGMTYQEGNSNSGGSNMFDTFDSFFGSNASTGVFIYSVNGENAKKAGFQPGDQVYAVDGEEISTFEDLSSIITAHKVGDKVKFTIIRDGTQKNIKLELEEKTASSQNSSGQDQNGQNDQGGQEQPDQESPDNGQEGQTPDQDQNGQTPPDQNQDGQTPPDQNQDGQNGQDDQDLGNWQDWFSMFF